jgi:aconitate hydratase
MLTPPPEPNGGKRAELVKGSNISSLPDLPPLRDRISAPVLLKVDDNVSTDEISPAGAHALPYRSNVPELAEFTFTRIDPSYPRRALEVADTTGHFVIGGENYGQGSSREHAAITPRYLGLQAVVAKSFARIHWQNLANFGVLALEFTEPADYDRIDPGDALVLEDVVETLPRSSELELHNKTKEEVYKVHHSLSERQVHMVLAGGQIPLLAEKL